MAERRERRSAGSLRRAISELPVETRRAMLDAVQQEALIVGAYTSRNGGVCPMLAAYRRGARHHVSGFPRAWDAFANAARPRAASRRELEILKALLQETLASAEPAPVSPARDSDPSHVPAG
jgi:hypothetical protein